MEATTNTWEVAELIRSGVARVAIANPLKVKAIAEAKTKTDKVDAGVLAQLLRCNFLPEVWIPDKTTRLLREMCAHRAGLVADQTCIKNRIQSLLAQRLIAVPVPVLFNGHGRNWLSHLELATQDRALIDSYLRILDQIESEEISLQKALTQLSYDNQLVCSPIPVFFDEFFAAIWGRAGLQKILHRFDAVKLKFLRMRWSDTFDFV